jgi:hypothetical protein
MELQADSTTHHRTGCVKHTNIYLLNGEFFKVEQSPKLSLTITGTQVFRVWRRLWRVWHRDETFPIRSKNLGNFLKSKRIVRHMLENLRAKHKLGTFRFEWKGFSRSNDHQHIVYSFEPSPLPGEPRMSPVGIQSRDRHAAQAEQINRIRASATSHVDRQSVWCASVYQTFQNSLLRNPANRRAVGKDQVKNTFVNFNKSEHWSFRESSERFAPTKVATVSVVQLDSPPQLSN